MKLLLMTLIAAYAVNAQQCPEMRDSIECFMGKADRLAEGIDFDSFKTCAMDAMSECMSSGLARFGMSRGSMKGMKECMKEMVPQMKNDMELCIKDVHDWFEFPDIDRENARPGHKLLFAGMMLKKAGSRCGAMSDCADAVMPQGKTVQSLQRDLCAAKTECKQQFPLSSACEAEKAAVRGTMCNCYKGMSADMEDEGRDMFTEMRECVASKGGGSMPAMPAFMKRMIKQKMEQKICSEDPMQHENMCESGDGQGQQQKDNSRGNNNRSRSRFGGRRFPNFGG